MPTELHSGTLCLDSDCRVCHGLESHPKQLEIKSRCSVVACPCFCLVTSLHSVCIGVSASGPGQLLTRSSLERAVGQLVQQTASLEALLTALLSEQQHTVYEM